VESDLAWIKSFEERFLFKVREENSAAAKDLLVQFENALYRFCTSNPHFNPKTGGRKLIGSFVVLFHRIGLYSETVHASTGLSAASRKALARSLHDKIATGFTRKGPRC
jgi:hypothetical protein